MTTPRKRRRGRKGKRLSIIGLGLLVVGAAVIATSCLTSPKPPQNSGDGPDLPAVTTPVDPTPAEPTPDPGGAPQEPDPDKAVQVTTRPQEITVLVNKGIALPEGYTPPDLVEPNVRFIFAEKHEKRLMRAEAASALEELFAAAEKDGIFLAGVSGYRSHETQRWLFNYYVETQGEETARKYSAQPGHSEHETGLAMDVSGSTGACAADDCFADTPEAEWLAQHAHEHGFIIRYPQGKESITGYAYEPWHLRYVGKSISTDMAAKGLTLEEYLSPAR